jgi:2-hydroxychromene-2-carboxylate isomerase
MGWSGDSRNTSAPITFFCEFNSPYSYIAARLIGRVAAKHGRAIQWRPISLGRLRQMIGYDFSSLPLAKLRYLKHDSARVANLLNLPFAFPKPYPTDVRLACRMFYHLAPRDTGALAESFAMAVFDRYWGRGEDIATVEQLLPLALRLGLDADELAAVPGDEAAKKAAMSATVQAADMGVFGAPTFVVDGQLFWGQDRIDLIDRWLTRQAQAA